MKNKTEDYYEILGVKKEDNEETIKKAYRKKAMQYHPDKNPGDKASEEMFKKVSEAYEILSDPNKKAQYDSGGNIGSLFANPQDIFSSFFGGNRGFSFSFGNQGFQNAPRISQDTKGVYRASLKDVITGAKIDVQLKRQNSCHKCFGSGHKGNQEKCRTCNGQGMRTVVNGNMTMSTTCDACFGLGQKHTPCPDCNGQGYHVSYDKISLTIPVGIPPLSTLRIAGKGNEVFVDKQKVTGDAYIMIDYPTKYQGVTMENGNIYTSITVPFTSVLNEDEITVNILDCKNIGFKMDANNKSGHTYKIEHGGVKEHNDAFVKVFIDFPKNKISDEDRQKLIKITREIYGQSPTIFKPESSDNSSGSR